MPTMGEIARPDEYGDEPVPAWLDTAARIGRMANPERFADALQRMPLSANVEDRRGEVAPQQFFGAVPAGGRASYFGEMGQGDDPTGLPLPAAPPPLPRQSWTDYLHGIGTVIDRGVTDVGRSIPAGAAQGLEHGLWMGSLLSRDPSDKEFVTDQFAQHVTPMVGYDPQTAPGRYAKEIASVMANPINWAGPGGAAIKAGWNALSGVGSETLGHLYEGTPYEGAARAIGSWSPLGAEWGSRALLSRMPKGQLGVAGGRMTIPPSKAPEALQGGGQPAQNSLSLFDYSKIHEIPDVPQFDLERYAPARGVSERVQDLIKNKRVEKEMLGYFEKGKSINADTFYYNEPLREAFVSELGKTQGPADFRRYMEYVGGSSPRSKVGENARNASYYYWLEKQGLPIPEQGGVNMQPYGHLAQNLHRQNAANIRSGADIDLLKNPKPPSFIENLSGNFAPGTIDAHAFKLPGMISRDPRFLAGSMTLEKGAAPINPAKMFASGDLTMKEALKRPVFWSVQPNPNEYGAVEQYYKHLARESGLATAQGQAAGWGGGGEVTGLGSIAGDPFMKSVENRAIITAKERGISPAEALSQMMRGKAPLLSTAGAGVMGALAAGDQYRQ